jgi:hypothetical protein
MDMRVTMVVDGGFAFIPGLRAPRVFDTSTMTRQEADALRLLVDATGFRSLPTEVGAAPAGAADFQSYVITIEEPGWARTVRVLDPVREPALANLIAFLSSLPHTAK